jgi:hypothetical protein
MPRQQEGIAFRCCASYFFPDLWKKISKTSCKHVRQNILYNTNVKASSANVASMDVREIGNARQILMCMCVCLWGFFACDLLHFLCASLGKISKTFPDPANEMFPRFLQPWKSIFHSPQPFADYHTSVRTLFLM